MPDFVEQFRLCMCFDPDEQPCSEPTEYLATAKCDRGHHKVVSICGEHLSYLMSLSPRQIGDCLACADEGYETYFSFERTWTFSEDDPIFGELTYEPPH